MATIVTCLPPVVTARCIIATLLSVGDAARLACTCRAMATAARCALDESRIRELRDAVARGRLTMAVVGGAVDAGRVTDLCALARTCTLRTPPSFHGSHAIHVTPPDGAGDCFPLAQLDAPEWRSTESAEQRAAIGLVIRLPLRTPAQRPACDLGELTSLAAAAMAMRSAPPLYQNCDDSPRHRYELTGWRFDDGQPASVEYTSHGAHFRLTTRGGRDRVVVWWALQAVLDEYRRRHPGAVLRYAFVPRGLIGMWASEPPWWRSATYDELTTGDTRAWAARAYRDLVSETRDVDGGTLQQYAARLTAAGAECFPPA